MPKIQNSSYFADNKEGGFTDEKSNLIKINKSAASEFNASPDERSEKQKLESLQTARQKILYSCPNHITIWPIATIMLQICHICVTIQDWLAGKAPLRKRK
jgi:hypothetical protein